MGKENVMKNMTDITGTWSFFVFFYSVMYQHVVDIFMKIAAFGPIEIQARKYTRHITSVKWIGRSRLRLRGASNTHTHAHTQNIERKLR